MIRNVALLTVVFALLIGPVAAAQQPSAPPTFRERCAAVLPQSAVQQLVANYRERLRAARENLIREERALRALLVADAATRAALDAQLAKVNAARAALAKVRADVLWDLRAVVPAPDRPLAFRCAERLLLRTGR
ncbi:MAG TPA: hypothetical protein VNN19_00020 [bacterium]|nr:hypothetical protein [bacterium]